MSVLDNRIQVIERNALRQRRFILAAAAVAFAVNLIFFWVIAHPSVPVALVAVGAMHTDGPAVLCAGDALAYGYTLTATEPGIVEVSQVTLRTTPEVVQYGGKVERDGFPVAMSVNYTNTWTIPLDALPGEYVRFVAVTAPGRVMQPSFGTLAFQVTACAGDAK